MTENSTVASGRRVSTWLKAAVASVIAVFGWISMWRLVGSGEGDVCPAIYPAPAGCSTVDRQPTAILWTVIIAVVFAACLWAIFTLGRKRPWIAILLLVLLAVAAVWGHHAVLYVEESAWLAAQAAGPPPVIGA